MESPSRATGIVMAILRLARAAEAEQRVTAQAGGLTPSQVAVLRFAARTRPDMATPGQLARVLGIRHATAVGIVNPLVERGLVERRSHPFDGRQSVLALTDEGRKVWERVAAWQHGLERSLASLPAAELETLEAAFAKVVAAEVREGRLVVSAPCAGCVHFRPGYHGQEPRPHHCALIGRALSEAESTMECPEHTPA